MLRELVPLAISSVKGFLKASSFKNYTLPNFNIVCGQTFTCSDFCIKTNQHSLAWSYFCIVTDQKSHMYMKRSSFGQTRKSLFSLSCKKLQNFLSSFPHIFTFLPSSSSQLKLSKIHLSFNFFSSLPWFLTTLGKRHSILTNLSLLKPLKNHFPCLLCVGILTQ